MIREYRMVVYLRPLVNHAAPAQMPLSGFREAELASLDSRLHRLARELLATVTRFQPIGEQVVVEMLCYQPLDQLNESLQVALGPQGYGYQLRLVDSIDRVYHSSLEPAEDEHLWSLLRSTGTEAPN